MARRSRTADPEALRIKLVTLLTELPERLRTGTVGEQVCELVEIHHHLRDLGASIGASLAPNDADSGRARLIAYFRAQVGRIVHTDELMIVAGIGDYPRRIRELRSKHGWPIISGMAIRDMRGDMRALGLGGNEIPDNMAPDEYLLIEDVQDSDAVRRWISAGRMRTRNGLTKDAILAYLLEAPHRRVTAEELRYVAGNDSSWPAAIRALMADGWRISSHSTASKILPPGIYILNSSQRD